MGERKGVNKYYPPDYDPSKGGLNKWQGTHALRERASKLHLGILIIRFEMPYNIWCDGCENHIGTGVRYNAEKKKVGMYYTTPVYEFRMKCHLCDNYFDIRTDPANLDYEIRSGARRQERRWDPADNEQVAPEDKAVGRKMAADAMYKLEHATEDLSKAGVMDPVIRDLRDFQENRWEDDFSANQLLRQRFRAVRREEIAQERRDARHNLNVPLLPPSAEDATQAALLAVTMKKSGEDLMTEKKRKLDCQSVFARMKPKRLSRALKKDVAKQSIHNLISATLPTFSNYKNNFDKQLGVIVRRRSGSGGRSVSRPLESSRRAEGRSDGVGVVGGEGGGGNGSCGISCRRAGEKGDDSGGTGQGGSGDVVGSGHVAEVDGSGDGSGSDKNSNDNIFIDDGYSDRRESEVAERIGMEYTGECSSSSGSNRSEKGSSCSGSNSSNFGGSKSISSISSPCSDMFITSPTLSISPPHSPNHEHVILPSLLSSSLTSSSIVQSPQRIGLPTSQPMTPDCIIDSSQLSTNKICTNQSDNTDNQKEDSSRQCSNNSSIVAGCRLSASGALGVLVDYSGSDSD